MVCSNVRLSVGLSKSRDKRLFSENFFFVLTTFVSMGINFVSMGINFVSMGHKTKFMGNSVSLSVVYIPSFQTEYTL